MYRFILSMFSNVSERFGVGGEGRSKCLVHHPEMESIYYKVRRDRLRFPSPSSSYSLCWVEAKCPLKEKRVKV